MPDETTDFKPKPPLTHRPKSVLAKRSKGREAFQQRLQLSENPYTRWNEAEEWALGWIEERDALVAAYLAGKVQIDV